MTVERDWITAAGLRAVVYFVDEMGHRCGYVGVPEGHPLFGVADADAKPAQVDEDGDDWFKVHGGLTYSGDDPDYPVPATGIWWFGYDCAHAWDAPAPGSRHADPLRFGFAGEERVHRTLEYCVAECESLAAQLQAPEIKARADEEAAQGHLIAAAPALLQTLRNAMAWAHINCAAEPEWWQDAEAAVAAATGGAP